MLRPVPMPKSPSESGLVPSTKLDAITDLFFSFSNCHFLQSPTSLFLPLHLTSKLLLRLLFLQRKVSVTHYIPVLEHYWCHIRKLYDSIVQSHPSRSAQLSQGLQVVWRYLTECTEHPLETDVSDSKYALESCTYRGLLRGYSGMKVWILHLDQL